MKKGISIWSFAGGTVRENLLLAKKAGFDGVELALDETGEVSLLSTEEEIREIRRYAAEIGMELYSVASGLYWTYNYTSENPENREKAKEITKKQLEVAAWLGCDTILVVPGAVDVTFEPDSEIVPYDIAYERALAALREMAPYAERAGVSIGIENVWNQFLLSPLEMKRLIEEVGSPFVGAYFDVGNVLRTGYPEHWIRILKDKIKKVHFKDFRKEAGGLYGFVDLLAGDVNWKGVMDAFAEIGYDDWVTAEMLPPYAQYPKTILFNTSCAMNQILGREPLC
ncbi:MAG: sugar phosphate isomerase/epimerase [Ruminococcaceae bacterium]|nr:sugar phosphate isomerase/epimerase [Oscillospiraceae bacterium]